MLSTVSSVDLITTNQKNTEMFIATTTKTPKSSMLMMKMDHITLPECGSEEMHEIGIFSLYDYSILTGMLVISLGIGKIKKKKLNFCVYIQLNMDFFCCCLKNRCILWIL